MPEWSDFRFSVEKSETMIPTSSDGSVAYDVSTTVGSLHGSHYFWRVPFWVLLPFTAAMPLWRTIGFAARRRRRRVAAGQCVECGYDLRASSGRCPECGAIHAL
jgi:hypothetical protein